MLESHKIVSHREWIEARRELLQKEKEFTRLRDQLSQWRRDLPWERVEKSYVFEGPKGKESLSDLFDGRSQLVVYHFMFRTGKRVVHIARIGRTILIASSSTSISAMSP
jgi:predicted dithiol-disulfide oxidoreductase (DUF899 family)